MTPERFRKLANVLDRRQPDLTLLTENVHKTHNLSAILRTADAVGLYEIHAISPGGEVHRHHMVSGGSRKWVRVRVHSDLEVACQTLRRRGHQLLAAHFSATQVDYRSVDYTVPTAVILGSELYGVSNTAARTADRHIFIPMQGMVASLNVSVAAALILFEAQRQREAVGMYQGPRLDPDTYRQTLFEWAYPEVAEICRRQGRPYPALGPQGDILDHPLGTPARKSGDI